MRRLMIVEGVFAIDGHRLLLLPDFPWGPPVKAASAEIRRSDGDVVPVMLEASAEHRCFAAVGVRPKNVRAAARVCLIRGATKADLPIGSELWCDDAFASELLDRTDA